MTLTHVAYPAPKMGPIGSRSRAARAQASQPSQRAAPRLALPTTTALPSPPARSRPGGAGRGARPGTPRAPGTPRGAAPLHALAPAGMCFSEACQAAQDRAFAAVVLLPLAGLAVALARWALAKPEDGAAASSASSSFVDPDTGLVFEAGPDEAEPEVDAAGRLAYRAVSYTPTPVPVGAPGDRVRVAVGPVGRRTPRTYVFERLLKTPSRILGVSLPRPLGVTWAEDTAGRVVVGGFVEGGEAGRRAAAAALDPVLAQTALSPGDVLRAITATNVVFRGAGALAGWAPGVREIVLFGADGAKWPAVRSALRKGDASDGDVTVIVEREERDNGGRGGPAPDMSEELNPDR